MLKAIIFDCDGIIADTEPLHLLALKKVLEEQAISITDEEYYGEFLALDDRGCLTKAFAKSAKPLNQRTLIELIQRKADLIDPVFQSQLRLFPGVQDFIKNVASRYPIAIASGARRVEIDLILKYGSLQDYFPVIVSTEDVANGKPHPESFLKAWSLLKESSQTPIAQPDCLVIEDSFHGIHAAHAAGMRCLAVTNSYPKAILAKADLVVDSLLDLSLENIESLFEK
jgi:HAD superfamily hydrolase (TIGR01509 family)